MKSTRDTFSILGIRSVAHAFDAHRGHSNVHRESVRAGLRQDAYIPFPFAPPVVETLSLIHISEPTRPY